jgi:hypothetical protein
MKEGLPGGTLGALIDDIDLQVAQLPVELRRLGAESLQRAAPAFPPV